MLINYLPEFMQGMKEIKVLLSAEDRDVEALKVDIKNVFKDQYFLEATENGLKHYEKMLGIIPKLTDSIEKRRLRLLARFSEQLPYTEITIKKQLEILCGVDGYSFEVIYDEYKVIVRIALISKGMFNDVLELLKNVLPANLILDLDLMYNKHLTLEERRHRELGKFRHIDLKDEVV